MPRGVIAGSYGNSFLVFWRTFLLFSIMVVHIYIPTNSVRVFILLYTISNTEI